MGLLGLALGVASIFVVGTATAFICDELSESEKQRQRKMQNEYYIYERRRRQEYYEIYRYYQNAKKKPDEDYQQVMLDYQQQIMERRKKEYRPIYNNMLKLHTEQYAEKCNLLKECIEIKDLCEKNIGKQQNTYIRFKSIKTTLISLEEATYKLQAYLEYLGNYKTRFETTFENSGEIEEPFSLTLPKDYPYEGKVIMLQKVNFRNNGYLFEDAGYIKIEQSDVDVFEQRNDSEILPFMMYKSKKGKKYLSLSKGMLKNSIGGTIGIDAEVKEKKPSVLRLKFLGNDYIKINLLKKDMLNQRRKTPEGSSLHVYIKDYDFALNRPIMVSEKVGDGLSIAQFESIMMVQTGTEIKEFQAYLKKNGLLDEDDEWRIAPLWDKDDGTILKGIIMQIGNQYAYKASFEEIEPERLILRYKGMLEKEEFVSFDDVFVTTNVTVDCYSPLQINEDKSKYNDLFEECFKLQLYLTTEFLTQRKMMVVSPMSVYLDQWTEITNRLIELLG